MSRAGATATRARRRLARELDEWAVRAEAYSALDAVLAACDRCGLVQVAPGPDDPSLEPWERIQGCVVCGCDTGSFLERLPGHAIP